MAFGAGNTLVLPVKFKCRFIMIKIYNLPETGIMTAQTISYSVRFKLPVVIILMAARTVGLHIGKLLVFSSCTILLKMTGAAADSCMRSCNCKLCL